MADPRECSPRNTLEIWLAIYCIPNHYPIIPVPRRKIWKKRDERWTETHVLRGVQARFDSDVLDIPTINQKAKEALIIFINLA